jgi:hypothetical protein
VCNAGEGAACGRRGDGHGAWHPTQGLQARDHGVAAPRVHLCLACLRQTLQALRVFADRAHLCLANDVWRRGGTDHRREPSAMGRVPGGPAGIADIVPPQEGVEPAFGGRAIAEGLFVGPPESPKGCGFHGGARDGCEVTRAQQPGQGDRVTAVGVDTGA